MFSHMPFIRLRSSFSLFLVCWGNLVSLAWVFMFKQKGTSAKTYFGCLLCSQTLAVLKGQWLPFGTFLPFSHAGPFPSLLQSSMWNSCLHLSALLCQRLSGFCRVWVFCCLSLSSPFVPSSLTIEPSKLSVGLVCVGPWDMFEGPRQLQDTYSGTAHPEEGKCGHATVLWPV